MARVRNTIWPAIATAALIFVGARFAATQLVWGRARSGACATPSDRYDRARLSL